MTNKQIEQQTSHLPNEITTREAFFQKLGTHKISDLTRKTDQGTHREMSLPVDDIYYSPERDTFTIKKELFDQINNEQKAKETQSLIDGTKSEVERTQQETAATAAAKQKTRELDAETRSKAELDKPLRNTYQ
ncbi:MAG: hypothetical protein LBP53_07025 [Candidatus Peribacteria bacterium]|jgi:hypothetical protein|nr:hypothetical protein [Candidatus Peribacteria bacterium]